MFEGRGLFSGHVARVCVKPAPVNSGIWFVRTDGPVPIRIAARLENVTKRARRTALRNGTVSVETVEHCLSACVGLGLDNLQIELDSDELPAVDGSCKPIVEALKAAGIQEQDADREVYVIQDIERVVDGDAELVALPPLHPDGDALEIEYDLDYGPESPIPRQRLHFVLRQEDFETMIAPARTFVLEREVEGLRAAGMGLHLSYQDLLVIGANGPIENALRFPDEFVRHKILDLIGDLSLLGRFIVGRIYARKSGHALNHLLVRTLLEAERERAHRQTLAKRPLSDIRRIQRVLPHRYPFLLVDRILEIEGARRIVGVKNVTINEEFFQGHYPGDPIMPGVLIIEAMSQISGVLLSQELEHKGKMAVLLSLDKVKFRQPVRPGDQLILEAEALKVRSSGAHVRARALVGGAVAAEGEIKFVLTDPQQ
ncbi:MAG: UDP-3-O-[3-hydroxymyristoyl] N-acetylglucosamine deacetylase [Phycisphaerales bacterium]|nr:MAG: UDP-3-O-[3-hydroxymyristoyl] N-acetylglucosamine deacetylase [Phycisphaerales bacterium]